MAQAFKRFVPLADRWDSPGFLTSWPQKTTTGILNWSKKNPVHWEFNGTWLFGIPDHPRNFGAKAEGLLCFLVKPLGRVLSVTWSWDSNCWFDASNSTRSGGPSFLGVQVVLAIFCASPFLWFPVSTMG